LEITDLHSLSVAFLQPTGDLPTGGQPAMLSITFAGFNSESGLG